MVGVAILLIGANGVFSRSPEARERIDRNDFKRSFEINERAAIERQQRIQMERPEADIDRPGRIEIEQSPVALCRRNPDLPQCRNLQ